MSLSEIFPSLFIKCKNCGTSHFFKILKKHHKICPDCGFHMPMSGQEWMQFLTENKSVKLFDSKMKPADPLAFPEYKQKISKSTKASKEKEAVSTGIIKMNDQDLAIAVLEPQFMLGTMGSVVGEKITRLIEHAIDQSLPLIIISISGGARMQEGIFSLMQMAKTSAALQKFNQEGLLYISLLTNPTTGGVSASFAMLGDIIIGEPKALIGFAGPRVIKQNINVDLPEGFQRSEFLMEHGMIDMVVHRNDIKETLKKILKLHS